jgi:predicted molibdopterin-dependent oxidoreductase YjgC
MLLEVSGGRIIGVLPQKGHPVSDGSLCVKGWSSFEFVESPRRLKAPLIRKKKGGPLEEASWDDAIEMVASKLKDAAAKGLGAGAYITSAKCTNEENYLLQKLARAVAGTNNVDHCARL